MMYEMSDWRRPEESPSERDDDDPETGMGKEASYMTRKNFECEVCSKAFAQRSDLNRHMVVHSGLKSHVCHWCGRGFSLKTNLSAHAVIHTGVKIYKCSICDREFARRDELKKHREVHAGEKIHKCEFCGKAFAKSSNLFRHMDIHSGVRNFRCDLCSKSFFQKTDLTRHMAAVHSGIKNFSCPTCGKEFSLKSNLTKHLPVHSGDKSHKCHVCNKGFFRKSSLASHLMIHIFPKNASSSSSSTLSHQDGGERPPLAGSSRHYSCDLCGKEFNRKSSLIRHHVVHSGERNFRCEICGKEFNRKSILERHMDVHADAKNISCGICGKEFNQKSNMDRHMAVHFKPQINHDEQEDGALKLPLAGHQIGDIKLMLAQKIRDASRQGQGDGSLDGSQTFETCRNETALAGVSPITDVRLIHGTRETRPSEKQQARETLSLGNSLFVNIHHLLSQRVKEIQNDERKEMDGAGAGEISQQADIRRFVSQERYETPDCIRERTGTHQVMLGSDDDDGSGDMSHLLNHRLEELTSKGLSDDEGESRRLHGIRQLMLLRSKETHMEPPSEDFPLSTRHPSAEAAGLSGPSRSDLESVIERSSHTLYSILSHEVEQMRGLDSECDSS